METGGTDTFAEGMNRNKDRLNFAMAQAAQDYDTTRQQLADVHGQTDQKRQELGKKVDALRKGAVGKFLDTPGAPLDEETAKKCLEYLELLGEYRSMQEAGRISYGATRPVGEQKVGAALE